MNKGHIRRRCPKPIEGRCTTNRCGHRYEWRFSHEGKVYTGTEATNTEAGNAMRAAQAKALSGELLTKREQREAEQAARRLVEQAAQEREQRVRLGDWLDRWLDQRGAIKPATRRGYADIIKNHVRPRLGDVPLPDLTAQQVTQLLEDLVTDDKGRTRSAETLARVRAVLTGALKRAVRDGLVPVNVAAGVEIPERATRKRKGNPEVFTPAQLAEFLRRADLTPFGAVLRFIAATGCRRGEAVGLRWEDVDLDAGTAMIRRSLTKVLDQFIDDTTKTGNERTVPLLPEVVTMLRRLSRQHAEDRLQHGPRWNPEGRVFVRHDGQHVRPDSLTQAVSNITTAMCLPALHLHSLRHSMGSAAIDAGVDVKVVADILGHASTVTTRTFYQSTSAEAARAGAEAIDAWRRSAVAKPVARPGG